MKQDLILIVDLDEIYSWIPLSRTLKGDRKINPS